MGAVKTYSISSIASYYKYFYVFKVCSVSAAGAGLSGNLQSSRVTRVITSLRAWRTRACAAARSCSSNCVRPLASRALPPPRPRRSVSRGVLLTSTPLPHCTEVMSVSLWESIIGQRKAGVARGPCAAGWCECCHSSADCPKKSPNTVADARRKALAV